MKLIPTIKNELVYVTSFGQGRYVISTIEPEHYDFTQKKRSLYWLGCRLVSWA